MKVVEINNIDVSYYLPRGVLNRRNSVAKKPKKGGVSRHFLQEIQALKNLSLTFHEGQRVGLVGVNGSGKSTLLKCISGALTPTNGSLNVDGRIASVLSLGGGLNLALSGRKNAVLKYHSAANPALGLNEFLEVAKNSCALGDYFDMPVSTYSSGMKSRLDRAMLNLIDGEIFLFDEWVVLGDKYSTNKENGDNHKLFDNAKLLLLASHSEELLREWVDELIWLDDGELKEYGPIDQVLKSYQDYVKSMRRRGV